jgi:hypothetical protein
LAIAKPAHKRSLKGGHSGSLHHFYDNYTTSALTDELALVLSSCVDCSLFEDLERQTYLSVYHPYIEQARDKIYRINAYDPAPKFTLKEYDLPRALRHALKEEGIFTMNQIITEAVRRIYESADHDYFHTNALYSKITWEFEK